jgi:hypothetical protein
VKAILGLIKILVIDIEDYYERDKFSVEVYKLMRLEMKVLESELVFGLHRNMLIRIKWIRSLLLDAGVINPNIYKLEQEIYFYQIYLIN